jgi:ankyrin repeat protein
VAAAGGQYSICLHLLRRHADAIEAQDTQGNTPLLLAALHEHWPVAFLLLEKGANPLAENRRKQTPQVARITCVVAVCGVCSSGMSRRELGATLARDVCCVARREEAYLFS